MILLAEEYVLDRTPFVLAGQESKGLSIQVLLRLGVIVALWLIGAGIYAAEGQLTPYLFTVGIYEGMYLPGIIIFMGAYGVQQSLKKIIPSFKPLLNKNDQGFEIFKTRIDGVVCSFLPCLVIGMLLAVFLSGVPTNIRLGYIHRVVF